MHLSFFILLLAVFFLACRHDGAVPPGADLASTAELEEALEGLRRDLRIPGMSAAIAKEGEVVWARGFGLADRSENIPADTGSVYHLASLTKPYAATVLLQLVEEGKLDIEQPVADFGIELDGARDDTVRVRHLLSHTSDPPAGSSFRYDGQAYGHLTDVIEQVTGEPFAAVIAERIIRPLGLQRTAPDPRDSAAFAASGLGGMNVRGALVSNYARAWGRRIWPSGLLGPMRQMDEPTGFNTATGLVASAPDVARFAAALDAGRLLADSTRAMAERPFVTVAGDTLPYGLGWFVQKVGGERVLWHYGHWYSDSALIVRVPQSRLAFVVLANSDGLSRWRSLGDTGDVLRSPAARVFMRSTWFQKAIRQVDRGEARDDTSAYQP